MTASVYVPPVSTPSPYLAFTTVSFSSDTVSGSTSPTPSTNFPRYPETFSLFFVSELYLVV